MTAITTTTSATTAGMWTPDRSASRSSNDTPLARMWRDGRMLRLADGPDEVHKHVIARRELARFR